MVVGKWGHITRHMCELRAWTLVVGEWCNIRQHMCELRVRNMVIYEWDNFLHKLCWRNMVIGEWGKHIECLHWLCGWDMVFYFRSDLGGYLYELCCRYVFHDCSGVCINAVLTVQLQLMVLCCGSDGIVDMHCLQLWTIYVECRKYFCSIMH